MLNINPMVLGTLVSWTPRGGIKLVRVSHEEMAGPRWLGTIPHAAITTARVVRHRIGSDNELDRHPSVTSLKDRGYVDYLACPLIAKHAPVSAVAAGTKRAGGFTDDEVSAIRRLQAPLARVVEAEILHENTISLLSTYVGRNAGEKVLDGRILRGYAENITAVILFADLSNFTALSNSRPPAETIATLNIFFDALDSAIRANGGETLKFIGDGLLAIFPTPDDITAQTAAAMGALSALDDARAALASASTQAQEITFRAALHVGDIHYGNIGSANRLDFTAVGPAVNSEIGVATVCSDAFAPLTQGRSKPNREVTFKGFADHIMVYTVE
jgi:adenylate cyclase